MLTGAMLLLLGFVFTFLGRMIRRGDLLPNRSVGIRIPSTLASDEAWYAGHRAALPALRWTAIGCYAFGSLALLTGLALPDGKLLGLAAEHVSLIGLAFVLVMACVSARAAHRGAQSAANDDVEPPSGEPNYGP